MDLFRKPWFVAFLSSVVTIFLFHIYHSMSYQSVSVVEPRVRDQPVIMVKSGDKLQRMEKSASGKVNYDARNCALFKKPKVAKQRTPNILENGRVRLADYETFPDDKKIECVRHHAAVAPAKICIIDPSKDSFISGSLRTSAGWEPHITGAFKRALSACSDCQVLDFGSNLGVYALIGASLNRRVFAVEPMHENLMHLVKSVRINNWQKRVTVITNTLSDVYEELEFWRPWSNAGGSIARKVGGPAPNRKLYDGPYDKVASVQIDNLLEVIDFNKAVMKIDIEGYEPRAFTGASRFFAQMDIPYIFMEWSNKGTDQLALKMTMNLAKMGYVVHDPNMNKLPQPSAENVKKWPFDIIWKKQ